VKLIAVVHLWDPLKSGLLGPHVSNERKWNYSNPSTVKPYLVLKLKSTLVKYEYCVSIRSLGRKEGNCLFCEVRNEWLNIMSKTLIFCKLSVTTKICYCQHLVFVTMCFNQLDHFHILRQLQNIWEVICKIKVYKNKWDLIWQESNNL